MKKGLVMMAAVLVAICAVSLINAGANAHRRAVLSEAIDAWDVPRNSLHLSLPYRHTSYHYAYRTTPDEWLDVVNRAFGDFIANGGHSLEIMDRTRQNYLLSVQSINASHPGTIGKNDHRRLLPLCLWLAYQNNRGLQILIKEKLYNGYTLEITKWNHDEPPKAMSLFVAWPPDRSALATAIADF